jgi:hypothetical protein
LPRRANLFLCLTRPASKRPEFCSYCVVKYQGDLTGNGSKSLVILKREGRDGVAGGDILKIYMRIFQYEETHFKFDPLKVKGTVSPD